MLNQAKRYSLTSPPSASSHLEKWNKYWQQHKMKAKGDYSNVAKEFRQFRPTYPPELYRFVFGHLGARKTAWDCGTGNGQVAYFLSSCFEKVIATDSCEAQILNAKKASNIFYEVKPAEASGIENDSINLVTSAQAVHWFAVDKFYREAKRVAKRGAIIALWGYNRSRINPAVDRILDSFYSKYLVPYWHDTPRNLLLNEYRTLPFAFTEIKPRPFEIRVGWQLSQLNGYLKTMSSVQEYVQDHEYDPVPELMEELTDVWGVNCLRQVIFPVFMRVGRIHD